jgi:hypothetical protein
MKHLLTHSAKYKLNPTALDQFVETLTEEIKKLSDNQKFYYQDDLMYWIKELEALGKNKVLTDADQEIVDALLYRIEELIVFEMVLERNNKPGV